MSSSRPDILLAPQTTSQPARWHDIKLGPLALFARLDRAYPTWAFAARKRGQ